MTKIFYDSTVEHAEFPVNEAHPLPVTFGTTADGIGTTENPLEVITRDDGLAVAPPVAGRTITRELEIPGIVAAAAYQALDAYGTLITIRDVFRPERNSGVITNAFFIDLDDEGLQKDVWVFDRPVTGVADNSPLVLTDSDVLSFRGSFSFTAWLDSNTSKVSSKENINIWINSTDTNLYLWIQTQGADNVAAANIPHLGIVVLPD